MKKYKVIEYGKEYEFDNVCEALNKVEELMKKIAGYEITFIDWELNNIKTVKDLIDFSELCETY